MKYINRFKNIDGTQAILLTCLFIETILTSMAYPSIRKMCGEMLPSRYFAIEGIICSVSIIIACSLWNKKSFRVFSFKIYKILSIIEIFSCAALGLSMYLWFNVWIYAIANLCYSCIISVYLYRIINSFRVALFPDRKREFYDNNVKIVDNVAGLIGLGVAAIFPLSVNVSMLLYSFGSIVAIGWFIVYVKNKYILDNIENKDDEFYIIDDIH